MPIFAIPMTEEWWVPPEEEAKAKVAQDYIPARFLLRPLSLTDRELSQNMTGITGQFGSWAYHMARAGLRGWQGVRRPDGSEVKFEAGAGGIPTESTLEALSWEWIYQLANELRRRSFLDEAARKNSASPST